MGYMKLGCNWGNGNPDYYEMIKNKSIIICSNNPGFIKGTYVAVCRGHLVVAIAKLLEDPIPSTKFPLLKNDFTKYKIDYNENNKIAMAKYYELNDKDRFSYKLQQGICQINNPEIIEKMDITIQHINAQLFQEINMDKYKDILNRKKNIILQGAPGTGKTYSTAALAVEIIEGNLLPYKNHQEIMQKYEDYRKSGQIQFTTFHQSMDYEDFVEGIKPRVIEDEESSKKMVTYEVENGIFKKICNEAAYEEDTNFLESFHKYVDSIKSSNDGIQQLKTATLGKVFWVKPNKKGNLNLLTGPSKSKQGALVGERLDSYIKEEETYYGWEGYVDAVIEDISNKYHYEKTKRKGDKSYVLIIDEINRGNVSKIFGELITLLEADKRELVGDELNNVDLVKNQHTITVTLPYSKDPFTVPSNLYIIGTMNTTDRSTGTLDYALRRRFSFITISSAFNKDENGNVVGCLELDNYYSDKADALKNRANQLFSAVYNFLNMHKVEMDIEDLMIGHSYFMANTDEDLTSKLEYEIKPLVREYSKDGIISISEKELKNELDKWN